MALDPEGNFGARRVHLEPRVQILSRERKLVHIEQEIITAEASSIGSASRQHIDNLYRATLLPCEDAKTRG